MGKQKSDPRFEDRYLRLEVGMTDYEDLVKAGVEEVFNLWRCCRWSLIIAVAFWIAIVAVLSAIWR